MIAGQRVGRSLPVAAEPRQTSRIRLRRHKTLMRTCITRAQTLTTIWCGSDCIPGVAELSPVRQRREARLPIVQVALEILRWGRELRFRWPALRLRLIPGA